MAFTRYGVNTTMQHPGTLHRSDMLALLAEFATYDASPLVGSFLRKALLFAYTDAPRSSDARLERQLALRLLARSVQIGDRFACLFINQLRGASASPARSNHVHRLSKRIHSHTLEEAAALQRILQSEAPGFVLPSSAFDASRYALCLEGALHDAIALRPADKDIVFRHWADLFAETVREAYVQYIQVLLGCDALPAHTQQDFVDTMPFSIEARLAFARTGERTPACAG